MDRYRVLDMIGEGSFGKVYKGRRRFTGHVVALKFISKHGKSETELGKLRSEIEILQTLDHPNIILLLDAFETGSKFCVVTEYGQGDLFSVLELDQRVPENQVQSIGKQLVHALFYLHQHRIIHRDMKPQNILISADGRVKLCDFGFARSLSAKTIMVTSIKGTPLYMAPEIVREQPYNHTADLWSLGVILYELFVGQPPFYTNNIYTLINLIVRDEVKYPAECSPTFKNFLKGLLMKDHRVRLQWPKLLEHPFVKETESERSQRKELEKKYWMNPKYRLECFHTPSVDSNSPNTIPTPVLSPRRVSSIDEEQDLPQKQKILEWKKIEAAAASMDSEVALSMRSDEHILNEILDEFRLATSLIQDGQLGSYQTTCLNHAFQTLVLLSSKRNSKEGNDIILEPVLLTELFALLDQPMNASLIEVSLHALRAILRERMRLGVKLSNTELHHIVGLSDFWQIPLACGQMVRLLTLLLTYCASVDTSAWNIVVPKLYSSVKPLVELLEQAISNNDNRMIKHLIHSISILVFPAVFEPEILAQLPISGKNDNLNSSNVVLEADTLKLDIIKAVFESSSIMKFMISCTTRGLSFCLRESLRIILQGVSCSDEFANFVIQATEIDFVASVFSLAKTAENDIRILSLGILAYTCEGDLIGAMELAIDGLVSQESVLMCAHAELLVAVMNQFKEHGSPKILGNGVRRMSETKTWLGINSFIQYVFAKPSIKLFNVEPYGFRYQHRSPQDLPGVLVLAILEVTHEVHNSRKVIIRNIINHAWESLVNFSSMDTISPSGVLAYLQLSIELSHHEDFFQESTLLWTINLLRSEHVEALSNWPDTCGGGVLGMQKLLLNICNLISVFCEKKITHQIIYENKFIRKSIELSNAILKISPSVLLWGEAVTHVHALLVSYSDHFVRQFVENDGIKHIKMFIARIHPLEAIQILGHVQSAHAMVIIETDFSNEFGILIKDGQPNVVAETCRLLGKLCRNSGEFYDVLVIPLAKQQASSEANRENLLAYLIDKCRDSNSDTRKFASFALGNAAYHSDALYSRLAVAIPILADLLSDPEPKTRANAAGALGNFVRNSGMLCAELIKYDVHTKLITLVDVDTSLQARRMALFSLGNLIIYKKSREVILRSTRTPFQRWLKDLAARINDEMIKTYLIRVLGKLDMPALRN